MIHISDYTSVMLCQYMKQENSLVFQKNSVSECFVQFLAGEFCSVQPFYEQRERELFPDILETEITAQCVQTV